MNLVKILIGSALIFFWTKASFTCHTVIWANTPAPAFNKGDEFIVTYVVNGESRDADTRINPFDTSIFGSDHKNISELYFKREGDKYEITYDHSSFAISLLNQAIAIAKAENCYASDITVRFFHASSRRSRVHAIIKREEGYPVYVQDSNREHQYFPLSSREFEIVQEEYRLELKAIRS